MRVSVIMSTYNGEKFIYKQLESIYNQTRKVDDVLIVDDASNDSTVEIIKMFIKGKNIDGWEVEENISNHGWKENFYYLLKKIKGDLIFYCDQDDVWDEKRVEKTIDIFNKNDDVKCLCCDYVSIDANDKEIKNDSIKRNYINRVEKIDYADSRCHVRGLGCLLTCNGEIIDLIKSLFNDDELKLVPPDFMLCRLGICLDGFYTINEKLVMHRFHDNNASNKIEVANKLQGSSNLEERKRVIYNDLLIVKKMKKNTNGNRLARYAKYLKFRYKFLCSGNLFFLIKAILCDHRKYAMILIAGDFAYFTGVQKFGGHIYRKLFS